jgi:cyclic pyranopterin phosphate synthase
VDTEARVGIIPSVSNPFCDTCDRVRLTADGQIKNCLFDYDEDDLRTLLRDGATQSELKEKIVSNYKKKWEGGCIKVKKGEYDPEKISRTMSRVGG